MEDSNDDNTTYDVRNVIYNANAAGPGGAPGDAAATVKPKLGGSAAEYSRVMREDPPRGSGPPPPPPADFDQAEKPTIDGIPKPDLAAIAARRSDPALKEPKPRAELSETDAGQLAQELSDAVARPSVESKNPSAPQVAAAKPEAKVKAAKAKAKVEAEPSSDVAPEPAGDGRPPTMMVDDAVWAMFVSDKSKAQASPSKEKKPAAHKPGKDEEPEAAARPGRVVRTSDWFGTLTWWITVLLFASAAAWTGYSAAIARSGKVTVDAREEVLRGIAADIERGGLAALLRADEALDSLLPNAPDLAPVLRAAKSEVNARIWAAFGHDPRALELAKTELAAVVSSEPLLEAIGARVLLSTSAEQRTRIESDLARAMTLFPESPKAWVLKAAIAARDERSEEALRALYQARELQPKRRGTLLALARWHARNGSYAAAFATYDELHERNEDDVEAALDRYVLGLLTGRDPNANEAASALAGLVRVEVPEVAKDEAGRVALAFAIRAFARGDLELGLEQLHKAEAAFDHSADFKAALGGVFLAVGEWDRASAQFKRALEIEPGSRAHRLGLARADFATKAGLGESGPGPKLKPVKEVSGKPIAEAVLPYGTTHFVLGSFALIETIPSPSVFPESAYAEAMRGKSSGDLDRAIRSGQLDRRR